MDFAENFSEAPVLIATFILMVGGIAYLQSNPKGETKFTSGIQRMRKLRDSKRRKRKVLKNVKPLPEESLIQSILDWDFPYYTKLSFKMKEAFRSRLKDFLNSKRFYNYATKDPRERDRMRILIAASAVQLTFGYKHLVFENFTTIIIYPDVYRSRMTKKMHHGEVHPAGAIVLDWKKFEHGISFPKDGRALGLHELTHAFHLENRIANNEFDFIDPRVFEAFKKMAHHEIVKMRSGEKSFFRSYGSTNFHEFFAVSVEAFFELTDEFEEYNQELFNCLSHLLKQDPRKVQLIARGMN